MTRRRKIVLISASALLALYLLLGFFYVPVVVNSVVMEQAAKRQLDASVGKIRFNPLTLTLQMEDFSSQDSNQRHLIGFGQLTVNLQASSLFRQALVLKQVELSDADIHVELLQDGTIHWQQALDTGLSDEPVTEDTQAPLDVIIDRLAIAQTGLSFHEPSHTDAFQTRFDNLNFTVVNLDTRPDQSAEFQLMLTPENRGAVSFVGNVSLAPLSLNGHVSLDKIDLAAPWRYARHLHGIDFASGLLDAGLDVEFGLDSDGVHLDVNNGKVDILALEILLPGEDEALLALDALSLGPFRVSTDEHDVIIDQLNLHGARSALVRGEGGSLVLFDRITAMQSSSTEESLAATDSETVELSVSGAEAGASDAVAAQSWQVIIDQTTLTSSDVLWQDRSVTPAVSRQVAIPRLSLDQLNALAPDLLDFEVRLQLDSGELASTGQWSFVDQSLDMKLALTQMPLTGFQGYLNDMTSMAVTSGTLDALVEVSLSDQLDISGSAALSQLLLINQSFSESDRNELLQLESISLDSFEFSDGPAGISIDQLMIDRPLFSLSVDAQSVSNLEGLTEPLNSVPQDAATASAAQVETEGEELQLTLNTLQVNAGQISFRDDSTDPDYLMTMSDISGRIEGLTNRNETPARVDMNAIIDGYTGVSVSGGISPLRFEHDTELVISTSNVELTSLNPYAGKYIGRLMNRGQLGLELDYTIKGRELSGSNTIRLGQIDLGDTVESDDAVSLPLDLAVALLKDSDGNIELSVPVSGELDDPEFRIGSIVFRAIMNLLLKTVASPFTLLSKLVPGGSEDMQFVAFDAASSDLADAEGQLKAIADLLNKRPGLRLDVPGLAYRNLDGRQLQLAQYATANGLDTGNREAIIQHMREQLTAQPNAQVPATGDTVSAVSDESEMLVSALAEYAVDETELLQMATRRAQAVKVALININEALADRVFVLEPRLIEQSGSDKAMLELKLGVN